MTMTVAKTHESESDLLTHVHHNVGCLTLNRPKALNSLNLEVIQGLHDALKAWERDPHVHWVLIEGAGDKAFCAGGDIRSVYYAKKENTDFLMDTLFRCEYQMNYAISQYSKPYVSLIHGICMGGGLGVSVHGTYRIVTDSTLMAMPETAIGFFPDIGASYFLNLCPGEIGMFLGLLGHRFQAGDALYTGIATHYVPGEKWDNFKQELMEVNNEIDLKNVLLKYHQPKESEQLAHLTPLINQIFEGDDFDIILDRLATSGDPTVKKWCEEICKKSPTSLKLTFSLLRRAKGLSLKEALIQEYRLSQACMQNHDFFEGVRALLIDKDNAPCWFPSQLDEVKDEAINAYFSPLGDNDLLLP